MEGPESQSIAEVRAILSPKASGVTDDKLRDILRACDALAELAVEVTLRSHRQEAIPADRTIV